MQLARGTDAFGLIFDNLLGFDLRTLRGLTNLYALLYERLLTSDSWMVTNAALQAMLSTRDGVELLRGGIVVPVRRDKFSSFAAFLADAYAAAKPMHGLCASDDFAALLDREARDPLTFSLKEVGAAYVAMAERILEEAVLTSLGVTAASAAIVARLLREAKAAQVDWKTNTWMYGSVCPQLAEEDRELVMEIARAPYGLNLPANVLHSGIAGPEGFRGDRILAALKGETRIFAGVGATRADAVVDAAFQTRVDDALVNWLLSNAVLEELTAEDLVRARSTTNRGEYLNALIAFLSTPDQVTWTHFTVALERYLSVAAQEVFDAWCKSGRIQVDPPDGQVVVEGATTIRIVRPDRPVELSGVVGAVPAETRIEVDPMQVIGKTLTVPRVEEESAGM